MNRRQVVGHTAGMILMVGAMLAVGDRVEAQDESVDRSAREQARRIEGVWLPIVTITDCQTHAVIATFPSMEIYVRGGGYVGFGAVQKSDQVGMGAWRHAGGRNYVSDTSSSAMLPLPSVLRTARQTELSSRFRQRSDSMLPARRLPARRRRTFLTSMGMSSRGSAGLERRRGCSSGGPDPNFRLGETARTAVFSMCRRVRLLSRDEPSPD